jgi:hypothetical protein
MLALKGVGDPFDIFCRCDFASGKISSGEPIVYRDFLGKLHLCILSAFIALVLGGCSGLAAPSITTGPTSQTVSVVQTATFSVQVNAAPPVRYQWLKGGTAISGATMPTYTTPRTSLSDSGQQFSVTVTNSVGSVTSDPATLKVVPGIDVATYHYDNARTGQNLSETVLTQALVNQNGFGLLGTFAVDGKVQAQPLYVSNLTIPTVGPRNVLYVVTEHATVFAFDADAIGSTTSYLWKVSTPLAGETSGDDRGCGQVSPEIGITSTPVIDRVRGAIYVVAMSKDSQGNFFQRLHALDLATGKELFGGPVAIAATYPGSGANSANGTVVFDPAQYKERPGLLKVGSTIYTSWASHCDIAPYTSWVIAYNADTLQQAGAIDLVPNGNDGGIWMSGAAPAADSQGNIYLISGNGTFDGTVDANGFPINANCGNCFVKISPTLKLVDYFTPSNTTPESDADTDFGAGGPLLLPDVVDAAGKTRHLAVGAGKDANIYVLDRDNLGKFNPTKDAAYQEITGQLAHLGVYGKPSYFNGTVYYAAVKDYFKAFSVVNGQLSTKPSSQSPKAFIEFPGAPVISASGNLNGIVWIVDNGNPAVLHAYDAGNLANELYNSGQAAQARDDFPGYKFITPLVVNGKVYVGTSSSVVVFGLLP